MDVKIQFPIMGSYNRLKCLVKGIREYLWKYGAGKFAPRQRVLLLLPFCGKGIGYLESKYVYRTTVLHFNVGFQ